MVGNEVFKNILKLTFLMWNSKSNSQMKNLLYNSLFKHRILHTSKTYKSLLGDKDFLYLGIWQTRVVWSIRASPEEGIACIFNDTQPCLSMKPDNKPTNQTALCNTYPVWHYFVLQQHREDMSFHMHIKQIYCIVFLQTYLLHVFIISGLDYCNSFSSFVLQNPWKTVTWAKVVLSRARNRFVAYWPLITGSALNQI